MLLEKDPQPEDFLQGRMLGNPYSSNEPPFIHSFIHCVFLCVSRRRMMLVSSSCCWRRTLSRKTSSRDACWATPTAPTNPHSFIHSFIVFFSVSRRRMMLVSSSCCWRRTLSRKTSSRDACWATPTAPTNPHSFIHSFIVFFSVSRRRMMLVSSSCCWRRTLSRKTSSRDACWATPTAPTNPHSFIHSFIVFFSVSLGGE